MERKKLVNTDATDGQARFFMLLDTVPYLAPLWDYQRLEYRENAVEQFFKVAAHGEVIMARFFLSVWRGDNVYAFDLIDAAAQLNESEKTIIARWFAEPFWP